MSAGDVIASDSRVIDVRVSEFRQLLNAMDPSPFRDRILTRVQRSLLSDGPAIYLATPHWHCGCTSNVLQVGEARAIWRPLEVFLYDRWPIRGEIRLLSRFGRNAGSDRVQGGCVGR